MRLRSSLWFDDPSNPGMTALYLERYLNFGMTRKELQSGRPIIGIAQTGSDLAPCNRHHLELALRVKDGIREAGGVAFEFPVHTIQETGKRPTAALDRNLAYLGLVEVLYGYPLDGVVLTTGCDKTTPAVLMAAATVNIPAIVLSGGPMNNGWWKGRRTGSGTIVWEARLKHAAGEISYDEFMDIVASSAPSVGHCNTMGTALTMNCLAEVLGMSLPGCAAIPATYRERGQMAFDTGKRIVDMVRENLRPSDILTQAAFENAIVANTAIGGSSNAAVHINAIARHAGISLDIIDWERLGYDIPLLVDYFIGRFGKKAGKKFRTIDKRTAELLEAYQWPGNVRELQNVIERAGILSEGDTFCVDETWLKSAAPRFAGSTVALNGALHRQEKEMIETALAESGGRVSGPGGAASKLGIPRPTLEAKIKRLGIDKYRFKVQRSG